MKKKGIVLLSILGLIWAYSAQAEMSITITDGDVTVENATETRTINLSDNQQAKLEYAMEQMGSRKYRLASKIAPIGESGKTAFQQCKNVISGILQGIYFKVKDDSIELNAQEQKKNLNFTKAVSVSVDKVEPISLEKIK